VDLDSFLLSSYVLVDDRWRASHPPAPRRPGRPALLADPEVLTLAILAQRPRFRGERDFWRFADAHLRPYFPKLRTQGQLNRRVRAPDPGARDARVGCEGTSPKSSPILRRPTASWTPPRSRRS
jgi:hypothetical protein